MTDLPLKIKYRELVTSLKEKARAQGARMTNEDIASYLGYDRTYFSSLLGERGKVTENHIKELKLHFPTFFEEGIQQTPAPLPDQVKGEDVLSKYVRLLESNQNLEVRFSQMATNLAELPRNLTSLTDLILQSQKEVAQKVVGEIGMRLDSIEKGLSSIASSQQGVAGRKPVQKGKRAKTS